MRIHLSLLLLLFTCVFLNAQVWETPAVAGYGKIKNFKEAAVQPDPSLHYKLLFDITSTSEKEGVNKGLWKVARTLNMLAITSIPKEQIHVVVAVHGPATYVVLNEEKHQEKFEKANPNIPLLKSLKEQGVTVYVCGQATAELKIPEENMHPYVTTAFSALSVLSNYLLNGYTLIP